MVVPAFQLQVSRTNVRLTATSIDGQYCSSATYLKIRMEKRVRDLRGGRGRKHNKNIKERSNLLLFTINKATIIITIVLPNI